MSGRSMLPLVRGRTRRSRGRRQRGRASRAILWDVAPHRARPGRRRAARPPRPAPEGARLDRGREMPRRSRHDRLRGADFEDELYDLDDRPRRAPQRGPRRTPTSSPSCGPAWRRRWRTRRRPTHGRRRPRGRRRVLHVRFAGAGEAQRVPGRSRWATASTRRRSRRPGRRRARGAARPAGRRGGEPVERPRRSRSSTSRSDHGPGGRRSASTCASIRPGARRVDSCSSTTRRGPSDATFAGPVRAARGGRDGGVASDEARAEVYAPALPVIDPARDLGVFVTRDRPGRSGAGGAAATVREAAREMQRMLSSGGTRTREPVD